MIVAKLVIQAHLVENSKKRWEYLVSKGGGEGLKGTVQFIK